MNKYLIKKLEKLTLRFKKLEIFFSKKNTNFNIKKINKISKEYSTIKPIVLTYLLYKKELKNINSIKELLSDLEIKEYILEEINISKKKIFLLINKLEKMLILKKKKKNNIFLEIRAGVGGAESSLFVYDLLRMYTRFSEKNNWKYEIISFSHSEKGGYKEIIIRIIGNNVYSLLKFESGVHRVQRIPNTETQGRIHTSTCSVVILPEDEEIKDIIINNSDIRIDTFKASGAGGQHVNKTDSAVRIFHFPTKITVECQNSRSQHKNKSSALKILSIKIKKIKIKKKQIKNSKTRKLLIGTGDRSEKIRTYNFPQNRITDHRINLTFYNLNHILDGNLEKLITNLVSYYKVKKLSKS
ncbi:peptide chain release factor 1 [Candidatus Zinderia endosymbiont of Aphrophora alni]|uniref:peptide chain release factor 1 n=1 Tax=Candidatus Zinderia endosymbiont of Aphrophora alni TaxID=3077951 RepID=UPI0030CFA57F